MNRLWRTGLICAACAICLTLASCDSRTYRLETVEGTVTLDGKPVAGATVNFQPIASNNQINIGPGSTAKCDSNGKFVLTTIHGEAGAVIGRHRVRIYSFSPETPSAVDTDDGSYRESIPSKYNYKTTLTIEVPEGGLRNADFNLKSDA